MINPWRQAEEQMAKEGINLDRIPLVENRKHVWADGILLWWHNHGELPTPRELASDMFDEWDDPVSVEEAEHILNLVKARG